MQQKIVNRLHHFVDRNGKAQSLHAGIGNLHRINADQPSVQINQRPAAIAFVNRRIRLDDLLLPVVYAVLVQRHRNHSARITHDPGGQRSPKPQRIANGNDGLPGAQLLGIAQINDRIDALAVDF
ncbi:hypothetical protein D3C74_362070 [compost metagenome]